MPATQESRCSRRGQGESAKSGCRGSRPAGSGCGLTLSPAEGFLLSRIDGTTPWTLLREIGGLAPGEADRCLERWLAEGLVIVGSAAPVAAPTARAGCRRQRRSPRGKSSSPSSIPGLEIPIDAQRRVLHFEAGLERPYHELLGVAAGVDAKAVKRAYFQLSKEYHPDRYYRREIGPYAEKLDRIFKKIVEAYELLMDPTTRAELERSMGGRGSEPRRPRRSRPPLRRRAAGAAAAPQRPRRRPRPDAARSSACIASSASPTRSSPSAAGGRANSTPRRSSRAHKQRWLDAAGSARLAIAFDPWNDEYKKRFGEAQAKVNEIRVKELLERAEVAAHGDAAHEALRLFEEALHYRPHDPVVNARAAEIALETGDLAPRARVRGARLRAALRGRRLSAHARSRARARRPARQGDRGARARARARPQGRQGCG